MSGGFGSVALAMGGKPWGELLEHIPVGNLRKPEGDATVICWMPTPLEPSHWEPGYWDRKGERWVHAFDHNVLRGVTHWSEPLGPAR